MNPSLDPQQVEWDVVVVGTGMGGATLGHALAKAGRRVVFVEKGAANLPAADDSLRGCYPDALPEYRRLSTEDQQRALMRGGRSIDVIDDLSGPRPRQFMPMIGSGGGGSTALYGMVCERLFEADFRPRSQHGDVGSSTVPEAWPVTYDEMVPWYEKAETLYRVRGSADPLRPASEGQKLLPPTALTPASAELYDFLHGKGLHPYRLHVACESVPECVTCQAILCPRACKHDAASTCLAPAILEHGATLLPETTAVRLEASRTSVTRVICERQGRTLALRARHVVLALGALMTPVLLMNSATAVWPHGLANDSDMVGRNLMRHFSEMVLVRTRNKLPVPGQVKEISFNDFYLPQSGAGREKLGNVQSFGRVPPADVSMNALPHFWRAFSPLIRRLWRPLVSANVLVGLMEDLPYADNRVLPGDPLVGGPRQRIRLQYRPQPSELRRMRAFRRCIAESLRPYRSIAFRTGKDNTWIAHSCGTCRFGTDPASSVLDRHNRAHGLDNLYVVDASFFPSSGGINPGLTIAANALRVAAHLNERF